MADEFTSDVKQFIDQNIESIAQLEALLLMCRDPERGWDAAEIAKSLYIPPELAATLLADFHRRRYVKLMSGSDSNYSYGPHEAKDDQLIKEIADTYQDRRVAITALIYSKPLNKVQTFADAFRLRKEPPS